MLQTQLLFCATPSSLARPRLLLSSLCCVSMPARSNALALLAADGRSDGGHLAADPSASMQPQKKAPPLLRVAFRRTNCENSQRSLMESLVKQVFFCKSARFEGNCEDGC